MVVVEVCGVGGIVGVGDGREGEEGGEVGLGGVGEFVGGVVEEVVEAMWRVKTCVWLWVVCGKVREEEE
ncbi:hypothetical protein, partial [Kocuria rhizophila]|uniref:hypothetical protein n=1 Tax=Kocuria rhizophila TaxID=72000 RepID=UPI001C930B1E